ncbi:MAG: hypothetical protein ACREJ3_08950 [Polyangiaceae bacterium]
MLVLAIASLWIAVPAVFQAFQRGAASGSRAQVRELVHQFGIGVARRFVDCPRPLAYAAMATFLFLPLLTLLATFDAAAGDADASRWSLASLRSPRGALVGGALVGALAVICAVLFVAQAAVAVATMLGGAGHAGDVAQWSASTFGVSCGASVAYVALWVAISASCATAKRALWLGLAVMVVLSMVHGILRHKAPALAMLLPDGLDEGLLDGQAARRWQGVATALAWCAAGAGCATGLLSKKSLA